MPESCIALSEKHIDSTSLNAYDGRLVGAVASKVDKEIRRLPLVLVIVSIVKRFGIHS